MKRMRPYERSSVAYKAGSGFRWVCGAVWQSSPGRWWQSKQGVPNDCSPGVDSGRRSLVSSRPSLGLADVQVQMQATQPRVMGSESRPKKTRVNHMVCTKEWTPTRGPAREHNAADIQIQGGIGKRREMERRYLLRIRQAGDVVATKSLTRYQGRVRKTTFLRRTVFQRRQSGTRLG